MCCGVYMTTSTITHRFHDDKTLFCSIVSCITGLTVDKSRSECAKLRFNAKMRYLPPSEWVISDGLCGWTKALMPQESTKLKIIHRLLCMLKAVRQFLVFAFLWQRNAQCWDSTTKTLFYPSPLQWTLWWKLELVSDIFRSDRTSVTTTQSWQLYSHRHRHRHGR